MSATDRTLRDPSDLDALRFTEEDEGPGLVPVVAQDVESGAVLMVAFASRDAIAATLATGEMHFWSRSRAELWHKGATSGNTLRLVSLHADCDADAVLARVRPTGPACHTGERTCFGDTGPQISDPTILSRLDDVLASRARERPEGSYTTRLLDDENLRLKKLGEEGAELVAALASGDAESATKEAADLVYHVLVALRSAGVGAADLLDELERRAG